MRKNLKNVAGVRHNAEMSRKRQSLLKKVLWHVALVIINALIFIGVSFGPMELVKWLGFGPATQMFVAFAGTLVYGVCLLAILGNDER